MGRRRLWVRLASWLLLVCFVLPLSRCDSKEEVPVAGTAMAAAPPVYLHGYDIVRVGTAPLLAALAVFFMPFFALFFRERRQSLILIGTAFPALYMLYHWMIDWGSVPQIGGILATECWLFLLLLSVLQLRAGGQAR